MDKDRRSTEMNDTIRPLPNGDFEVIKTREEHKQVKITIPESWEPKNTEAFNRWASKLPVI